MVAGLVESWVRESSSRPSSRHDSGTRHDEAGRSSCEDPSCLFTAKRFRKTDTGRSVAELRAQGVSAAALSLRRASGRD